MLYWITYLFESINIAADNEQIMISGLVIACLAALVLRLLLFMGYSSQRGMVRVTAKELSSKEDIGKLKVGPFARAAKEYAVLGERGIGKIDARTIVERDMSRFRLLFWNYKSIEGFVLSIENSVLFAGILFTVIAQSKETFAIITIAAFLAVKLFASILDFSLAKEKYITNTSFLLDREIGRFYITDNATAVNALAAEMKTAVSLQSEVIKESILKLGDNLTDVVKMSMNAMTKSIESTMESISNYSDTLEKPVHSWKMGLEAADAAQNKINASLGLLNNALNNFSTVAGAMGSSLQDYKNELNLNSQNIERQLLLIGDAVASLKEITEKVAGRNDIFEESVLYIKENQKVLEQSIQQYEVTLKGLTAQMGDGLGKIVDFHVHEAYSTFSEGLKENMKQLSSNNNELLVRLQDLFSQMQEQSRGEMNAILSVKQQMEAISNGTVRPI